MQFGLTLCNHGAYADPAVLADLAVEAEDAGWDGVFVWDHVARDGEPPMTDPWIALTAIAVRTSRVLLGPMVTPLARRRPVKVARETVALDRLSGGRFVLGIGLGVHPEEFAMVGDEPDPVVRGAMLDEAMEVIAALWTAERVEHHGDAHDIEAWHRPGPVQQPRIPVWVGGTWPNRPPFRRAARWDGAIPATGRDYRPDDYRAMHAYIADQRAPGLDPVTMVHVSQGPAASDRADWRDWADAGVDWWLESFRDEERDVASCRAVIAAGPPTGS